MMPTAACQSNANARSQRRNAAAARPKYEHDKERNSAKERGRGEISQKESSSFITIYEVQNSKAHFGELISDMVSQNGSAK